MLAKVLSCAVIGLDVELVQVEVDITNGLERVTLVGLPDTAVRESSERVRAAITNSGLSFPNHRLTINLAPADLRKEGPAYDLPIAVGILAATRQVQDPLDDALFLGELSLDGSLRHVNGVLLMANMAVKQGYRRLFVPAADAIEASLVQNIDIYPVDNLAGLAQHLRGTKLIAKQALLTTFDLEGEIIYPVSFQDIKGQEIIKRALEVACAGGHNVLMLCSETSKISNSPVPRDCQPRKYENGRESTHWLRRVARQVCQDLRIQFRPAVSPNVVRTLPHAIHFGGESVRHVLVLAVSQALTSERHIPQ